MAAVIAGNGERICGFCCRRRQAQGKFLAIEPKTYFANERTFFHWISPSAVLLVGSFFLSSDGGNATLALTLMILSSILILYALFVYLKRIQLIKSRSPVGYYDCIGPIAIASILILGGLSRVLLTDHVGPLLGDSLSSSSEECAAWPLRMESGLAFQTNYRLSLAHTNATHADVRGRRLAVREALSSIHVEGAVFVSGAERAWQQRSRVLINSKLGLPELRIAQNLGEPGDLIWVGAGSPTLPCGLSARLEYEVGCAQKHVLAIGHAPIPSDTMWAGEVDLGRAFSGTRLSLSFAGFVTPAKVESISMISFEGLAISDMPISVVLRSSDAYSEVVFSVPGNNISDSATQDIAHSVWEQLVQRLLFAPEVDQCLR